MKERKVYTQILMIPVSTVSPERSFSELKHFETYTGKKKKLSLPNLNLHQEEFIYSLNSQRICCMFCS